MYTLRVHCRVGDKGGKKVTSGQGQEAGDGLQQLK